VPELPAVPGKKLVAALEKAGFVQIRQKGSHVRMRHSDGRVTTIPLHTNQIIGKGLLRKILRDVEWSIEDLIHNLK
jgi:predicted RNA binding protein YcfA (HicA-like mRNA interferase family)